MRAYVRVCSQMYIAHICNILHNAATHCNILQHMCKDARVHNGDAYVCVIDVYTHTSLQDKDTVKIEIDTCK